jgi:hypothetical protein
MANDGYGYRLSVKRNYDAIQIRFDVRISKLPIHDFEQFSDTIRCDTAIHEPEQLLAMLTEGLENRERAIDVLKEAMSGKPVEVHLGGLVSAQLRQRLGTSTVLN